MTVQSKRALRVANASRLSAANIRRKVREGDLTLPQALANPRFGPARVDRVLKDLPGFGPFTADLALRLSRVSPEARVRELSEHDRAKLVFVARELIG